jgi:hypothetical protein
MEYVLRSAVDRMEWTRILQGGMSRPLHRCRQKHVPKMTLHPCVRARHRRSCVASDTEATGRHYALVEPWEDNKNGKTWQRIRGNQVWSLLPCCLSSIAVATHSARKDPLRNACLPLKGQPTYVISLQLEGECTANAIGSASCSLTNIRSARGQTRTYCEEYRIYNSSEAGYASKAACA